MPSVLVTRILSVAIVVLSIWAAPTIAFWMTCVFALGLAHYAISVVYSRRQIVELARAPQRLIPVLSLGAWGVILFLGNFPLVWFFALHHAFNEAYLLRRIQTTENEPARQLRSVGVLLHVFVYLTLLRHDSNLALLPTEFLFAGLGASYGLFFYYLSRLGGELPLSSLAENCGFELMGIVAVIASLYIDFSFLQIVMYHFVFWMLYPLPKLWNAENAGLPIYVGITIVCTALFVWLAPTASSHREMLESRYFQQFTLWSYFHITTAFALSNAHPDWIVRLFRPRSVPI